jgi:threonine synthase
MTGHGLKDPDTAIKSAGREPIVTKADKESVCRAIGL